MEQNALERNKDWESFLGLFLQIEDKNTVNMLFNLFLTMNEKDMMIDRYLLVKSLLEGNLTQREIAEKLHLSISKITSGSKAVQILQEKDRNYLERKFK